MGHDDHLRTLWHKIQTEISLQQNVGVQKYKRTSITVLKIEITSWLVSAYDFYSRVVKDR